MSAVFVIMMFCMVATWSLLKSSRGEFSSVYTSALIALLALIAWIYHRRDKSRNRG